MRIALSNICTAFQAAGVIGSKVLDGVEFFRILEHAVAAHDFSQDRIPGQGFIQLPTTGSLVSAGVGRRREDPQDYVLREYRGRVAAFLKREFAAETQSCAVVVYTKDAYLNDPDITPEETRRIELLDPPVTHLLVTVLASAGPSQLSPHRFTANLAGGNHEAQAWTADEIRAKAKAIMEYDDEWVTVADPA